MTQYNPDQFEIVAFRKGDDGKDLVYSFADRSQSVQVERETAHGTAVLPSSHSTSTDTRQLTANEPMSTETASMPVCLSATSIPGMIKNAEGKINGKNTYARITIRKRV